MTTSLTNMGVLMVREKVVQNEHTHVARFCLSGEGCAANDRSGTCSGRLRKTGHLTIAQLLGHDVVLFCYRVAFCRFHLISGQVVSFILAGVLSTVLLVSVVLPNH